jgi:F-type H+-transporting ATPase subunit O
MYGVAGKYASALYVTAVRKNALEPVETELKQVCGAARTNPAFADFLKDPSVSKTVRVQAIEGIFRDTKFNDVTKNLLAVLAENGRLSRLQQITSAYSELLRAHRGEILAVVTAALELSKQELEDIKNAMKGYLKPGQTLTVEQKVDRSIIGGIVVDIEDKHIDLSIDTKIKQMEKLLAELV